MVVAVYLLLALGAILGFVIWYETRQIARNEKTIKGYGEQAQLFVDGFESLRAIIDANAALLAHSQNSAAEMRVELELLRAVVETHGNALHLYAPVLIHLADLPPLPRTTNS